MEFKCLDAPAMTRSMQSVLRDLPVQHLWVVYPGPKDYRLDEKVTVLPVTGIPDIASDFRTSTGASDV